MITADDLRKIPLQHGSFFLHRDWDSIRQDGLNACGDKEGFNTFDWDRTFGRHKYVFLQPLNFCIPYALGDAVVVSPAIVEQEGTCCFLDDPGAPLQMFSQIDMAIKCKKEHAESGIQHYAFDKKLREILRDAASHLADIDDKEWYPKMCDFLKASPPFRKLYEDQSLTPDQFYETLASICNEKAFSVEEFVNRTRAKWKHSEEVCILDHIGPEYVLGAFMNDEWIPATEPPSGLDLDLWLNAWRMARTNKS